MNNNIRSLQVNLNFKFHVNLMILILAVLLFGLLSIALGQDINWDLRSYHFYGGYSLLNGRIDYDYAPAGIQTFLNPILHIPTYILLSDFPPKFTGFMIGSIQGLNFWLVYLIARTTLSLVNMDSFIISLSLAVLGIISPMFISEIGTTFGDNITSILILLSVLLVLMTYKRNINNKYHSYLYCTAGLGSGAAAGIKLTNLVYAITLLAAIFIIEHKSNKLKQTIITFTGVIIGVILTGGYWMWLMSKNFGNPLFPFYNAIFKSSYFPLVNWKDNRWSPDNILDALSYPFLWSINKSSSFLWSANQSPSLELPFRDITWLIILILLLMLALSFILQIFKHNKILFNNNYITIASGNNTRYNPDNFIIIFTSLSFFLWLFQFGYQRYLIPLELLSGITIWCLINKFIEKRQRKILLYFSLFTLIILTTKSPNWERLEWGQSWFGVTGTEISGLKQTLILMVDNKPISYVIPFFPQNIRFVRIDENFIKSIKNTLFMEKITSVINEHNGDLFGLAVDTKTNNYSSLLRKYGLEYKNTSCQKLVSRLEHMSLCPLQKIKK